MNISDQYSNINHLSFLKNNYSFIFVMVLNPRIFNNKTYILFIVKNLFFIGLLQEGTKDNI